MGAHGIASHVFFSSLIWYHNSGPKVTFNAIRGGTTCVALSEEHFEAGRYIGLGIVNLSKFVCMCTPHIAAKPKQFHRNNLAGEPILGRIYIKLCDSSPLTLLVRGLSTWGILRYPHI